MNDLYEYKGRMYPAYLKAGPGSRFIEEFARFYCRGEGINIGYGSDAGKIFKDDCLFLDIKDGIDCTELKIDPVDFIFSSHCLEHLLDWKRVLVNWSQCLRIGGCLFLYLPHFDMEYWRPENNKKHKAIIFPNDLESHLSNLGFDPLFVTGRDLYWSYCCVGWKPKEVSPESGLHAKESVEGHHLPEQ